MTTPVERAAKFIAPWEGYHRRLADGRCTTYLCPAKVLTIGYGSTGRGVTPGAVWAHEKAMSRHKIDVATAMQQVLAASPVLAENDGALIACTSFVQNLGIGRYRTSTLKRRVDEQNWSGAKAQFMRWVYGGGRVLPGLVKRRAAEAALLPE